MSAARPEVSGRGNFTISQFLDWAGVGRTMAYAEVKAGRLIMMKCGNRTLIRVEDAEAWRASLPRVSSKTSTAPKP